MANHNDISILLIAQLDTKISIATLNNQISEISKKIDKLNFSVKLDDSMLKGIANQLNEFSKNINSSFSKRFADTITNFAIDISKKLPTSLGNAASNFQSLSFFTNLFQSSTVAATVATKALTAAMTVGLSIAITLIISAITAYITSIARAKEEQKKLFKETNENVKSLRSESKEIKSIINEYNKLSSITNKTVEEKEALMDVSQKIANILPEAVIGYTAEGEAILGGNSAIVKAIENKEELLEIEKELLKLQAKDIVDNNNKDLDKNSNKIQKLNNSLAGIKDRREKIIDDPSIILKSQYSRNGYNYDKVIENYNKQVEDTNIALLELDKSTIESINAKKEALITLLPDLSEFSDAQKKIISNYIDIASKDSSINANIFAENIGKIIESLNNSNVSNAVDTLSSIKLAYALLVKAQEELNTSGDLTIETFGALYNKFEDFEKIQNYSKEAMLEFVKEKINSDDMIMVSESRKTEMVISQTKDRIKAYSKELEMLEKLFYSQGIFDEKQYMETRKHLEEARHILNEMTDYSKVKSTSNTKQFSETLDLIPIKISNINKELSLLQHQLDDTFNLKERNNIIDHIISLQKEKANTLSSAIKEYQLQLDKELSKLSPEIQKKIIDGDFSNLVIKDEKVASSVKSVQNLISTIDRLDSEYNNMDNTIRNLQLDHLNNQFALMTQRLKPLNDELETLEYKFKLIETDDITAKTENINNQLDVLREQVEAATTELINLGENGYEKGSQASDAFIQKQTELTSIIRNGNLSIKQLTDSLTDMKGQIANNTIKVIQESYQKQQKIIINSLREQIRAEESAHRKRIEMLDEQLSKYEEIINQQIRAIDKQENQESFEKQLAKLQEERAETIGQINMLSMDDSLEARQKVAQLNKQLTEQDEKIEEFKHKRQVDLRKQSLHDNLDAYRKEIEGKKKTENDKLSIFKDKIETEIKLEEWKFDKLINNEERYAKMRQDIIAGNLTEVQNLMDEFLTEFERHNEGTIKNIDVSWQSLLNNISNIKNSMQSLSSISAASVPSQADNKTSVINAMKANSLAWWDASEEERKRLANENLKLGTSMGWTRGSDGIWYDKNGIRVYHKGGIVGDARGGLSELINKLFNTRPNEQIVKALNNEVMIPHDNIAKNFIPNMQSYTRLNSPRNSSINSFKVDVIIDKVIGSEKSGQLIGDGIINSFRRKGLIVTNE